ncbi:hypothetical protein CWI42_120840 [Ordospora colligata]|uniref:Uncharacterized protein n=1 Tax=Ordospora colligata OC4 TaxID=1354746 RepID=A0A0B2UIJ1_9MICR|nr:uncharacterized protein M896_120840 [Ordospora colligata OC4]KHN68862.1 hypothetical protein M896_120840 [Ordospora colligata OC4]TBU13896.1 hypothetical protein CWI40_120840 [Ordospora colligata]TBU14085.1 hypothetical protein CWI41_120840 [Ordospora colligata]TBU17754.1 hypothetical protein CWI42_120840 [Ordospora colligata]
MSISNFMTTKEKDYVAECLRKNTRHFRANIDCSALFDPNAGKIEVKEEEGEPRKSVCLVFGKKGKKSSKASRISFGIEPECARIELRNTLMLEEIIDLYTINKHCKISETDFEENRRLIESRMQSNFDALVTNRKFFWFLKDYLMNANNSQKHEVLNHLQRTFQHVKDVPAFYELIGTLVDDIPRIPYEDLDPGFVSTFIFFPCGVILATLLLLQNNELCSVMYESTVSKSIELYPSDRYSWQFFSVLISLVDADKQSEIVKLLKPCIIEAVNRYNETEECYVKLFLDAIGIGIEEIQEIPM